MLTIRRITCTAVTCALIASAMASGAAARPSDMNPAHVSGVAGGPEIRTSSLAGTTSTPRQDLRMPDTRDAAEGRGTFNAPLVTVLKVPQRQSSPPSTDGGLEWADAGIGAAGMLGTVVLLLAGTALVTRRRSVRAAALA